MYEKKRILAIIPARGGSKGLIGKNNKLLNGKPLISWSIDQAKKSSFIDEIFVSTDCENLAMTSGNYGIDVPFLRPSILASDTASSTDVVFHVLSYFENKGKEFDYIILLEPTSPLRKHDDIDSAIRIAISNKSSDGVISLGEVHMEHPMIVKKVNEHGRIVSYINNVDKINQRQQADKAYFPYGVVYLIKTEVFKKEKSFYTNNMIPFFIERWQNYEVDDIVDFDIIELLLKEYLK